MTLSLNETRLLTLLERAGFPRTEPDILLDAEIVRFVAGEELSSRLFLTTDSLGNEKAMRHDYTLPLTLQVLQAANKTQNFSYLGKVFRHRDGEMGEFTQSGIESFGCEDNDAEILALAIRGVQIFTDKPLKIIMGDMGIFIALIDALGFNAVWKRRITRDFRRGKPITFNATETPYAGVLAAIEGANPLAAKALVTDLLSIAGIQTFGGRSVNEIAERFLEQSALQNDSDLPHKIQLLNEALAIEGTPRMVWEKLKDFAKTHTLELTAALNQLSERCDDLKAKEIDEKIITLKVNFAREPDYYNGLAFEIYDKAGKAKKRLVGGGRYDRMTELLSTKLGEPQKIPAVGCSFWIEGLENLGGKQ